mmetsp:Transcript_14184/g.34170  ORF Transcript_14184/g.34170 Transcript_14184/m.34170 type:complete len:115 (-) Transcript_14184:1635-1979(-)
MPRFTCPQTSNQLLYHLPSVTHQGTTPNFFLLASIVVSPMSVSWMVTPSYIYRPSQTSTPPMPPIEMTDVCLLSNETVSSKLFFLFFAVDIIIIFLLTSVCIIPSSRFGVAMIL